MRYTTLHAHVLQHVCSRHGSNMQLHTTNGSRMQLRHSSDYKHQCVQLESMTTAESVRCHVVQMQRSLSPQNSQQPKLMLTIQSTT